MHSSSRETDLSEHAESSVPHRSTGEPDPATLKAVLWDMDGTLVDTEPYWIASEQELVEEHGGSWSHQQALTLVGQSLWFSAGVLQEAGIGLERRAIIDELTRRVINRIRGVLPWRPGARELLADLRQEGLRCALVTMSEGPLVREILAALPSGSFEFTVTGDQVENGKPHPEPYLRAVALLGQSDPTLSLDNCIALEDSVPGVQSALAAGLTTIGIPHSVPLPEDEARITWTTLSGRSAADLLALKAQVAR
ncbi:HAD superfamily hydrolase (TIGR01509 family) [Psychromicrobium silvestre]|uniref:HAD superfamily hydrolase (TIGR01509 family) n=1 Tax=Psychromicrobium silvestre TaxID=1645614 RepID=A0A7Y9LRH8_9MICC|nr:HAD family phosphatase [Psychromicrobium silvestre]NYE94255.1 HAD superfamily hydrolase (TIGR01509 family) [Psychromicrobium silvestre]